MGVAASRFACRVLAAGFALGLLGCGGHGTSAPNLVLVVVDTLRADHLAPYGYGGAPTPRFARFASEGARVARAYAPTATTGPTHAGLFTGRPPRNVGVLRNAVPLAAAHETLAERLSASGFETAAVVSSFPLHRRFGFDQGFATYLDDFDPRRATVRHTRFEGHAVPEGFDRRADDTTRRALEWLASRTDPDEPFFLFVHYFDPHEPYAAPRVHQERFAAPRGATHRERAVALYDAEVDFTDSQLGRLLDGIDEQGDDTFVVVTADHGEGLFQRGHLFHDVHLYEEGVRVPLLVRGPGIPAGHVVEGPATLLDLWPTILDLLGVARDGDALAGRSLAAALRGEEQLADGRALVLERRRFRAERVGKIPVAGEQLALVRAEWKLIESGADGRRELYDLGADPREREDRSAHEAARVSEMASELAEWRKRWPEAAAAGRVSEDDRARLEALGYVD